MECMDAWRAHRAKKSMSEQAGILVREANLVVSYVADGTDLI